jgi:hypothetical protein
VSSATGRAEMLEPWVAWPESWKPGPRVARPESRALHRVRQSDCQPLFHG